MGESRVRELLGEASALRLERSSFDAGFDLIRRFIWPSATEFLGRSQPGAPVYTEILDSIGEEKCELAAAGMQSLVTNPYTSWHGLDLEDWVGVADRDGARTWLNMVRDAMLASFGNPAAKFYTTTATSYGEAVAMGNWCYFSEDRAGRLPLYRPVPMATVWWSENAEGDPDALYRRFELAAWAARAKWGDALPEKIIKCCEDAKERTRNFAFWHCVVPRDYGIAGSVAKRKPYASFWLCEDPEAFIAEGGYDEQPYMTGRWNVRSGESYGRGPGHRALGIVQSLQRILSSTLKAAEKSIDPPTWLPDDGVVGPVSFATGALNYIRAEYLQQGIGPRAIDLKAQPQMGLELVQYAQGRIGQIFLTELLNMIRDPRATATQVLELREEQSRGMAPILQRLEQETLGRTCSRQFAMLQRAGLLPPPPPDLVGRPIRPAFTGAGIRAQRLAAARGIAQLFEAAAPMMQLDPGVADNIDLDEAVRDIAHTVGVPTQVLRPMQQVLEMRKAKQQVEQNREGREEVKDLTTGAKNIAPLVQALGGAGQQEAA